MKSNIEIAQEAKLMPIMELTSRFDIHEDCVFPYGKYKAKICLDVYRKIENNPLGKLILVTAMTPTAYGEGKTTVAIGLSMGLNKMGKKSIVTLREPSLGPVFGIKGGATGGGYAQVVPMEEINLHFTGDIHAVGAAHNLLAAVLDNHVHFGNPLDIDEREIYLTRAIDMNDRSLRRTVIGLGGRANGPAREDSFIITTASEVMAILALSNSVTELKERLGNILVASDMDKKPVFAKDLGIHGAMAALLTQALMPNIAQTIDQTPAFIHCGPFANIAHGTCSIVSMKMAQRLCEYTVVEAGFGSDLGGEKFIDIVSRVGDLKVDTGVIVATVRALKMHGGASEKDVSAGTTEHLKTGLPNLGKHIENVRKFGVPPVVSINVFEGDTETEIGIVKDFCESQNTPVAETRVFTHGAEGALALADIVDRNAQSVESNMKPVYELDDSIEKKIERVALEIYGASGVTYTTRAERDIRRVTRFGLDKLPVCVAKTNSSLSDDPKLHGRPENFKITIGGVNISAGAGFLVPLAGDVMLMPGLPKVPNATKIDVDEMGRIHGLS
ncbi:formate--tetrahydrofolate ligase [candidate division WOR_3 bacterium SM23_42]|uniref:Formate--tetrahydrofolate ligase n=1 Tax=candidate division WOR_3 bacterium SM23_42 TaxID=1703779 RepID=A0A0S8FUR5_UNCW3|nr:MAG: formate--tetrahydrofolate ligase [candidate division WOR_3 bacterium SM23_42]